jgi:adenylate cyclase
VILAQRLSAEAKAGETLVTQRAFGTVEDAVEGEEVGPLTLKGFQRPVPALRVTKLRESKTPV